MHTFTNVITSLVCFPIANALSKIAYLIIPDHGTIKELQPEVEPTVKTENNTAFNIFSINIEILNMFNIVQQSIQKGLDALLEHETALNSVLENRLKVNQIYNGISRNLMLLMSSNPNMQESKEAASLFSMNLDLKRMSAHAINIAEAGDDMTKNDLSFSVVAYDELAQLTSILFESLKLVKRIINGKEFELFDDIKRNEDMIDDLCIKYRGVEIGRMKESTNEAESGVIYSELLIDIERIGDHIMNIAENLCEIDEEGQ